jgi:hypothetical protein
MEHKDLARSLLPGRRGCCPKLTASLLFPATESVADCFFRSQMTMTGKLQRMEIMKELSDLSTQHTQGWKYVTLRGREPVQSAESAARLRRMALLRRLLETSDARIVQEIVQEQDED